MQINANLKLDFREFEVDVLANSHFFVQHSQDLNVELRLEPGQLLQTHITESKKTRELHNRKRGRDATRAKWRGRQMTTMTDDK